MFELFLLGSWMSLWSVGTIVLVVAFLLGNENEIGALLLFALGLAFIVIVSDSFRYVNWLYVCIALVVYVPVGVLWSFHKWNKYLRMELAKCEERTSGWTRLGSYASKETYLKDARPKAKDHSESITAWMVLWPFSVSWWVLTWPRIVCEEIFEYLKRTYDRMAERVFQ